MRSTSTVGGQPSASALELHDVLDDVARGTPVVVLPDRDEFEPLLICAAAAATPRWIAFMVRHGTGFLRVAVTRETSRALGLPSQMGLALEPGREDQCVSVDAGTGTTTGISAHDRALTLRLLGDPATPAEALSRPGHVVPVRCSPVDADARYVDRRPGKADVASELVSLTSLAPSAAYSEIVSVRDATRAADTQEALEFAAVHRLRTVTVATVRASARAARSHSYAMPA